MGTMTKMPLQAAFLSGPVNHHGWTIAISTLLLKVISSLPVSTTEGLTSWG